MSYIKDLASIDEITIIKEKDDVPISAIALLGNIKIFIPLEGLIDIEEEKKRLNRKYERGKKHYQNNKHYYSVKCAKQRALKLKQTFPQGVECKEILLLYKKRNALNKRYGKNKYSVDHIIPLKNKYVCGLHNIKNLRVLLTKENLKKSNKFIPGHNEDFYNKKFW